MGNENTLSLKDLSNESDEHQLPIVLRGLSVRLNEFRYRTTHQVRVIYLIFVTDVGHLILENIG